MTDKNGNKINVGSEIQFDDDYFGHSLQHIVKETPDGILGFEAIPNVSQELCHVEVWFNELVVITDDTIIRRVGRHVTTNGESHVY